MALSNNEVEEVMKQLDRDRIEKVSPIIKKYVAEKVQSQGRTMREDHVQIVGQHANFLLLSFTHKPKDFIEILTDMHCWEDGYIDHFIDHELEQYFPGPQTLSMAGAV